MRKPKPPRKKNEAREEFEVHTGKEAKAMLRSLSEGKSGPAIDVLQGKNPNALSNTGWGHCEY